MAASHIAEKHLSINSRFPCLPVSICCLPSPAWHPSTLRLEVLFVPHLCSTQQWIGALSPSRGDRLLPRVKATPRCDHPTCSRRVHLMLRGGWTALPLFSVYMPSCGFYYTLRGDTDSSHVPPKGCVHPLRKKHSHRRGDSLAISGVFRPGLQPDLKDGN